MYVFLPPQIEGTEHVHECKVLGRLKKPVDMEETVSGHPQPVHCKCSHGLEDGEAEGFPLL